MNPRKAQSWLKLIIIGAVCALSSLQAQTLNTYEQLPEDCEQLILVLADTSSASAGSLFLMEKGRKGWDQERTTAIRLGKNGLAEGIGVKGSGLGLPAKREGDGKTPAGLFELGAAFGYDKKISKKRDLTYVQVTPFALFVEDPKSPYYNQYRRLHRLPVTDWEKKQLMKQDDPAHALKLFVKHNTVPQRKAGYGSAIFLHIWREDGDRPTTGCTVMAEKELKKLIKWIDPKKNPLMLVTTKSAWMEAVEYKD